MVQVLVKVETFLKECFEKIKKYPRIWICLVVLFATISLIWFPYLRVSQFGINNVTENAILENQYRATIAQTLGGIAVAIGIYSAWKNIKIAQATLESNQNKAQEELKIAQATLVASQENTQKNLEVAQATLIASQENTQKRLEIVQDGQITDRFTKAVDQLGFMSRDLLQ
jgi:hypothetical protein